MGRLARLALASALAFLGSACIQTADDSPTGVFDYVWSQFDARYGNFDLRDIDWDAARDRWRPQVRADSTDEELWDVLTGLLAELDDGHVRLAAPGREVFYSNHVYRDHLYDGTFDIEVVKTYLSDVEIGPFDGYVRGLAAPDLPYAWFPWIDDNTYVIDTLADEYPDAIGLIIDLRQSGGGAFTYPLVGLGRMAPRDTPIFRSRSRNGPGHEDFDAWKDWELPAREPYWGPPIFLLTDGITISASERMILMCRELPGTTLIGTPSNGSLATSIVREAPNGWGFQLSVQEVLSARGERFEGVGIPVDVASENDVEDVAAGRDATLELAIDQALGQ